jgi:hypothetical protein
MTVTDAGTSPEYCLHSSNRGIDRLFAGRKLLFLGHHHHFIWTSHGRPYDSGSKPIPRPRMKPLIHPSLEYPARRVAGETSAAPRRDHMNSRFLNRVADVRMNEQS